MRKLPSPSTALKLIGLASLFTLAGAFVFEYGFGLKACALCLQQRYPYYGALVLCLIGLFPWAERRRRWVCLVLALIFAVSAVLGGYHAGVEWSWFIGPRDCAGINTAPISPRDLQDALKNVRVANCAEAAWRLWGVSLAGWNALISLMLAAFAATSFLATDWRYGSSSVSQ
jgi:disulfide bond formation protein DsbB